MSSRSSSGSSLGSSSNIVSSTVCGGVGASARGSQTSGLAGGCQPGANSGCSGAATGCGPPYTEGSRSGLGSLSGGLESALIEDDFDGILRAEEWPQALVDINMEVSDSAPSVGQKVDVVLTVKALENYPVAIIEILLPTGVEYISGDLNWAGGLGVGEEKTLTAAVQAVQDGVWEIVGKMIASEGEVDRIGKMDKLVLLVGVEALQQYNSTMKAFTDPEQSVIKIADPVVAEPFVALASPGTVTIYGYFGLYECRCDPTDDDNCPCPTCTGNNCASNGGASHLHGLPYMLVEAWDDDVVGDDLIASTYTDVNGYYIFANIDNNDPAGGTNEWYLKFIVLGWPPFQTAGGDGYTWVQSLDESKDWNNAYFGQVDIGNLPDGTDHNVGWRVFTDSRNANILYAVMKECFWMYNHCYGWDMPNVVVFYPGTTSATDVDDYEIEIAGPGKSAYDHAMDDDVVIHEYAHDMMYYYYRAWPRRSTQVSPAGVCSIAVEGCSGGCTICTNHGGGANNCSCDGISEGWANFVAALVPEEWNSRNWATDRYVVSKDGLVYRDHESNAFVHEYHEMTFARILWDILDPIDDGETVQVSFERGATASDYDENPIWWEMTRQNPANDHSYQEEPYTLVEFWIFWLETFPWGSTTVGEPELCNIYSLHGVTRDFTNRCSADCYGYCNGACAFCVPNCADDPCGGAGCPGVGCVSADCTTGWCDIVQPGQGCNGVYPSQCNCYSHGITSICSNADPATTCVSGCWINPCACGGAGCPGAGCYTCTAGYCDADSPAQGCNGVYPSQCNCYGNGVPSICSNADPAAVCVSGCWINPCTCGNADCPSVGCYDCGGGTVLDWCDCGFSSCLCGYEIDCVNGVDDFMPCGGASVNDWCDCGNTDCTCGFQVDCINGVDNYMPCEGVTVKDNCNCGFVDCNCEPQFECVYGVPGNFLGACAGNSVNDPCNCNGADCSCPPQVECAQGVPDNWQPCAGVIPCECGGVGCGCPDYCSLAPPPPGGWILLATDPDEGVGTSLAEIYGQRYSGVIYFRVGHHRPWATIADIDTGIFIDADQDPSTGMPDGTFPGQITGIGADYLVIVGAEGPVMWRWDPVAGSWDTANPIALAYLDAPDGVRVFVVGVYLADLVTVGALDCAVADPYSGWDWMPDTGHFTLSLPAWTPCGGTVPDWCDCGGADCDCGFENDCAAFPVDNFMPCGGASINDWCNCGGADCGCGFEIDCVNGVDDFMPCGGATIDDPCDCGGAGCACGFEVDCVNGVDDFMPCGGVTSCECGGVGCACVDYCSLQPPSPGDWILLATDADEGFGTSLAEIYGQRYSGVIYFMVGHYRPWATITDIDTAILIDADQNPGTGQPGNVYPGQNTGIGADYLIIVGWEGTEVWRWDPVATWWDLADPIALAYLDAPDGVRVFVVGVYLADLVTVGALDCAVTDVNSNWDWMPDIGHFTLPLAWTPCGGTVVDTCDCGIPLCACGSEDDCAAFPVDDYWPCEISTAHDVAVLAITPSKTIVGQTYPMTINVTVENHGTFTETFTVTVFANATTIGSQIVTLTGGSTIVTIPWDTTGFDKGDYSITATAEIVPCEIDTTDNTYIDGIVQVVTPGDVNADGIVNIVDAAGVSAHWYPGPPIGPLGYDPNYDINNDGVINILDAAIVSAYWTGPPKGPLAP